jgi:type IV pilus assembly protein PilW
MRNKGRRQQGFSIVELMIGVLVGLMMFAGAIHVYVSTIGSSDITMKATKLNQEMRAILHMIANDLRRAGYWSGSAAGVGATNPFTDNDLGHDLRIAHLTGPDTGSCVTFTYNRNASEAGDNPALLGVTAMNAPFDDNDVYAVKTNVEMFGYRLNGDKVQVLSDVHTAFDCDNGTWADLNDNDVVTITSLSFAFNPNPPACTNVTDNDNDCNSVSPNPGDFLLIERKVDVSLSARLAADTAFTNTITQSVKIRNDRIVQAP